MITVLIHLNNADAVKLDIEELPKPTDSAVVGRNPRDRADKEVTWIEDGVTTLIFPLWRVNFVEILPSAEDAAEFPLPFRNE